MRPYVWNGISHTQYHMGVVIVPRFLPVMSVATSASSDLSLSIKEACSSKSPRNSIGGSYLECKVIGFFQTQTTSPGLRHLHTLNNKTSSAQKE